MEIPPYHMDTREEFLFQQTQYSKDFTDVRGQENIKRALEIEPYLNPKILAAVQVPDGVFEPYRFCLSFLATAVKNGACALPYHEVVAMKMSGTAVAGVRVLDHRTGKERDIDADLVVKARRRYLRRGCCGDQERPRSRFLVTGPARAGPARWLSRARGAPATLARHVPEPQPRDR